MRSMLLLVIGSTVTAAIPARALADGAQDQAAALVQQGATLGKEGRYKEALGRFKQAEAEFPQAEHDCWIAVTYFRMQRLSQAQYFLDRCQRRSTGAPKLPWFPQARAQIARALAAGGYAPVSVETQPEGAPVRAPGFATDEVLTSPVTLWLAPGKHLFAIETRSGLQLERLVTVEPSRPSTLQVALSGPSAEKAAPAPTPVPPPQVVAPPQIQATSPSMRSTWSWIAVGGGAAAALTGALFHYWGYEHRLAAMNIMNNYDTETSALERDRAVAFGLYAVGAVAIGTGIYLLSSGDDRQPAISVGGSVGADGAAFSVSGRF